MPLGRQRFQERTGIYESQWSGRYWTRWSDLIREAGLEPNSMNLALDDDDILRQFVLFIRELGRWPTEADRKLKRRSDTTFPSHGAIRRLGNQSELAEKVCAYCEKHDDLRDIAQLCEALVVTKESQPGEGFGKTGYVYLMKSGRFYKIGLSNDVGRRVYELAIQLPEKLVEVHRIETDDPQGIERYWHQRFAAKRLNGEWFKLDSGDVATFKRRKRFM